MLGEGGGNTVRRTPLLLYGMPAQPVEGRVPARQRLRRRGRVSAPDADGWREILPQLETQPAVVSVEHRQKQLPQARRIPAELHDRCFNCLSYSHRVATCRLPWRCLRCHGLRHLARECTRPRAVATVAKGANLPRQSARDGHPASHHAPHGGSQCSEGAALGAERAPDWAEEGHRHGCACRP
jgi:hypothetical protein